MWRFPEARSERAGNQVAMYLFEHTSEIFASGQ
jgi:hypothetical protein